MRGETFGMMAVVLLGCGSAKPTPQDTSPTTTPGQTAAQFPSDAPSSGATSTDVAPAAPGPTDDERVTKLDATDSHACGLRRNGQVFCLGRNESGQLGPGPPKALGRKYVPLLVPGIEDAVDIAVGWDQSCVIRQGGSVWCWGKLLADAMMNSQPGAPPRPRHEVQSDRPRRVVGLPATAAVTLGRGHVCALTPSGEVWCWGENYGGALGDGLKGNRRLQPARVEGLPPVTQIDAGPLSTCARTEAAEVYCWGSNFGAISGDGKRGDVLRPRRVPDLPPVRNVQSLGESLACAVLADQTVRCWGKNAAHAKEWSPTSWRPEPVAGLTNVERLFGEGGFTCVRRAGRTECWGASGFRVIGDRMVVPIGDAQVVAAWPLHGIVYIRPDGHTVAIAQPPEVRPPI